MRPTLRQVFGFSLFGLILALGLLFYLVLSGTERTILQSSERYRDLASEEVGHRVKAYLDEAPMAVTHFEQQVQFGLIDPRKVDSVQHALLSLLLANHNISEATLTYANPRGTDREGNLLTDPATAGQVAVLRTTTEGQFVCKKTWFNGKQFVSQSEMLPQKPSAPVSSSQALPSFDPTAHPTFQAAISKDYYGQIIATDLHWSQIDEMLPEQQRRVEVSVQKAIEESPGHFAGVLRVGLMKSQIDGAVQQRITSPGEADPHLIFLCDNQGRLITGFGVGNHLAVSGDDLRVRPGDVPSIVARSLQEPALKNIDKDHPVLATSFRMGNDIYLSTFRYLPGTQDWIVGIVVPRDFYLGSLLQIRRDVLEASLLLSVIIVLAGVVIIRTIDWSHSLILRESARMKDFEFTPSMPLSFLRDVVQVLEGLEKAKTAMRAMSKYVPVDLVRELYHKGQEPMLGGKSCELTVMFTDIKDFTAYAESIPADQLAEILGRYLQVMAETIQNEKGTIDKYIGDAVMTFWNAPELVSNHEILACRAALRCREAVRRLYASPSWGAAPKFETRFGIHRCTATVGHFGAPDRLNYTAIGDGINLASRLEGLNKRYGTSIIVSESVQAQARDAFVFRLLDRVAVKGKTEGITIYELVADRATTVKREESLDRYEEAYAFYQTGDFAQALGLFEAIPADPPSRTLAQRCRDLLAHPPKEWTGIHSFDEK